jgi:queuine tRNA-ribosyltransferase
MTFHFNRHSGEADGPRLGTLHTNRGEVQTPAFMPVATRGLMRGPWHSQLRPMGVDMMLANAFHLFVRPGVETVQKLGGVHGMMGWDGPVLTDSGGFQAFSLSSKTKVTEQGFKMQNPVQGGWIDWTPAFAFEVQAGLAPDIAMILDVCPAKPLDETICKNAIATTLRWAKEQRDLHDARGGVDSGQAQFGIVQGGVFGDLRESCAKGLVELDFDGYAVGGVSVGEGFHAMMAGVENSTPFLPVDKIRYLMGVGTPLDLVESVARGIDIFDCVWPMRAGRFATAITNQGKLHLLNAQFTNDTSPIEPGCPCDACISGIPRGALRAGFKSKELLPSMMVAQHNLFFIENLMRRIREAIRDGSFETLRAEIVSAYPMPS